MDERWFWIKGAIGVFGSALLLVHLIHTEEELSVARVLRYVTLLAAGGAVVFATQEQLREGVDWRPRQWGGLFIVVLLLVSAVASIWEDWRTRMSRDREEQR